MVVLVTDRYVKVPSSRRRCRVVVQPNAANGPLKLGQCAELLVGTHKVKEEKEMKNVSQMLNKMDGRQFQV